MAYFLINLPFRGMSLQNKIGFLKLCDDTYFRQLFFRKSETLWKLGGGRGVYPQIYRANFKELRRGVTCVGCPSNPASVFSLQMGVCVCVSVCWSVPPILYWRKLLILWLRFLPLLQSIPVPSLSSQYLSIFSLFN